VVILLVVATICKSIVNQNLIYENFEIYKLKTFREIATTWSKQFHQIRFVNFIVVPLKIAGVSVNIRKNARNLRICLACFAFIAVFPKSTLDKKQSALLFIESNDLINLKEALKRAIAWHSRFQFGLT